MVVTELVMVTKPLVRLSFSGLLKRGKPSAMNQYLQGNPWELKFVFCLLFRL